MEENKCECKYVKSVGSPPFLGGLIAYELAIVIILLLFIHIDFNDLKETLNRESLEKDSDQAE